jgi:hypothetical protein
MEIKKERSNVGELLEGQQQLLFSHAEDETASP